MLYLQLHVSSSDNSERILVAYKPNVSTIGGARGVIGGARGVMVIVVGNGHGDTSSKPGREWLHFT